MGKEAHAELLSGLMCLLSKEDQAICQKIVGRLTELQYIPQRQKVQGYVLAFKNHQVNQTIAKIGVKGTKSKEAVYSIKFYACKNPPEKFLAAVQSAVSSTRGQYECCNCGLCGAATGERGYRCKYPENRDFIRCGAYVVETLDLAMRDVDDLNNLLTEQHTYFSSRFSSIIEEG